MRIEWRSYADMTKACRANIERVRELRVDAIVGIPRSGMLPASIIATSLALPLADIHTFCARRTWAPSDRNGSTCEARRILLVDDASAYKRAMPAAVDLAKTARPDVKVLTCAVYATPETAGRFSLVMEAVAKPRLFEWNWWRSGKLKWCGLDIDGVICRDPTRDQRRNPDQYLQFLASAAPLYVPAKGFVGALVTGRSNDFRPQTEDWMRRHGVAFGALKMYDGPSPRNREKHAENKAKFYRAHQDLALFFESSDEQAKLIAEMSGKPVVSVGNGLTYGTP